MIDIMIDALLILGIVIVSVPTLLFAVTGMVHLLYLWTKRG